jgi:hypothetical protein
VDTAATGGGLATGTGDAGATTVGEAICGEDTLADGVELVLRRGCIKATAGVALVGSAVSAMPLRLPLRFVDGLA